MTTLAHISDLHFGREHPRVIEGVLDRLASTQPEIVIISGDITQRARTREFESAQVFLARLEWPYLIIPGNHDISVYNLVERFGYPWRKWHRYIGDELEPVVKDDSYVAIGVNTTRRLGSLFNWSRGRISEMQIKNITRYLAGDQSERLRVIAVHHPFWLPGRYQHYHIIGGRDLAIREFKKSGVDIILSGHVHYTYTHLLNGIVISHAGTAVSTRLLPDSPNSFKIVRGNCRQLSIETLVWNGTDFSISTNQLFKRTESGWFVIR